EQTLVHAGLDRENRVAHVELPDAQPRAHLRAHVAADPLADPAEVEGRRRLGYLLRLRVDVVDDVVRTHQHAGAALAAAAEGHHLVHHLLEGDVRHAAGTLAQQFTQRKRRGPALARHLSAGSRRTEPPRGPRRQKSPSRRGFSFTSAKSRVGSCPRRRLKRRLSMERLWSIMISQSATLAAIPL